MRPARVTATTALALLALCLSPLRAPAALGPGDGMLLKRSPDETCQGCHKTDQNAPTDPNSIKTHNSITTGSTKWSQGWGIAGGKYGRFACTTCHTPHDTTNIYLIKQTITTPDLSNWSSSGTPQVAVDFRYKLSQPTGTVGTMGDDSTPHSVSSRVCEACHSRTKQHDYNSTKESVTGHYNAQDCTGCHAHKSGFKVGESGGGTNCSVCHSALYTPMNGDTSTYHHRLSGDAATYPTNPTPADADKRCLQCHVDHNIFRSDLNTANSIGRGANLRVDILTPGATGAPGTTYTNTDFVASATNGGICISCHQNVQQKNSVNQKPDGTTATPAIPFAGGSPASFQNSPHQYQVPAQFAKDGSTFNANCSKCHNDTMADSFQSPGNQFGNHDSTERRISASLGLSPLPDPVESNLCYRCHARTTDAAATNKTTANKDWYGVAAMTNLAEQIYSVVTTSLFRHDVSATGLHKPYDEGRAANDGTLSGANRHVTCSDCHNPHAAQQIAAGAAAGTVGSYATGTPDTLTDAAAKGWTADQWVGATVKILGTGVGGGQESAIYGNGANTLLVKFATSPASGSAYIIFNEGHFSTGGTSDGNRVKGSQTGVWGVAPTWPAEPAPPTWNDTSVSSPTEITTQYAAIATWNRTDNATLQGDICIKCHSAYAYGSNPPNTPSGAPNSSGSTWGNAAGAALPQGDKANEFNPNNLGYHPLFARGQNQPVRANFANASLTSVTNTNWPKYGAGTIQVANGTATITGGTLPNSVLPGWFVYIGTTMPTTTGTTGTGTLTGGTGTGFLEITGVTGAATFTVRAETGGSWPNPTYTSAVNVNAGTAYTITPGLGATFVPPWGPWSTLTCTDCHASDTSTDPMGPHGSNTKYLLKKAQPQAFLALNASGTDTLYSLTAADPNDLCLNCHRFDVYGDYQVTSNANSTYSRQPHPCDTSSGQAFGTKPTWGIVCMNCHGGARAGSIHGDNLGKGANGSAGSYSGKRLLSGAYWNGVTRSGASAGSCFVKKATDSVSNCSNRNQGAMRTGPTYRFDDTTP